MSRKLTPRERWVVSVVPALLVLMIYVFGAYRPMAAQLRSAQQRYATARDSGVTESTVRARQKLMRELQARVSEQKLARTDPARTPEMTSTVLLSVRDESIALARVTDALKQHDVIVLKATRLTDTDARAIITTELADSLKQLSSGTHGGAHGVWKIELDGSFGSVRDSLRSIGTLEMMVLPLNVAMEPAEADRGDHRWSVWFWI